MSAWIKQRPVDVDEAVRASAKLLSGARCPLLAGLAADLDAVRAAFDLASSLGACVDPAGSDALYVELSVLSGSGMMATTFAEARARGDCLLVVGRGPWRSVALADLVGSKPCHGRRTDRIVLSLGAKPPLQVDRHVLVPDGQLPAAISLLRARLAGRMAEREADRAYAQLARALSDAAFGVLVCDPLEIGELGLRMLQGIVRDLNQSTRCTSLVLGSGSHARAALGLSGWRDGMPPRIGFGRGAPRHDPWRFDAARMTASGECDAILWLASLPCPPEPWLGRVPAAAIVGDATGEEADIVIEVAVPGVTSSGVMWDDRLATFRHCETRGESALPDARTIVEAIAAATSPSAGASTC
jgi:formylmethanofuran dehydrogenase subunit B